MPDVYEVPLLRRPQHVAELGRAFATLQDVVGNDITKRGNMSLIENDVLIYSSNNSVVFENISSKIRKYLLGLDENGVGCVTVHPSR